MATKPSVIFCLFIGIMLFSCVTSPEKAELVNGASLQGSWQDHLDPNYLYFAGSTHSLTFTDDSFFLKIHEFTDIATTDTCSSTSFTTFLFGEFSIGNNDSITLEGTYVDSLKNPMPYCGCKTGPRQSGRYHTTFRGRLVGNTLRLTNISYSNMPDWELTKE